MKVLLPLLATLTFSTLTLPAEPMVIADFEGPGYSGWTSTGTAFGTAPAQGALPGQMSVEGFLGKGLVNSYQGGDRSTGILESPPFRISRRFITFLIGGGGWQDATCLNLIVDGKTVRTATGPNTSPGGSERLGPLAWDVAEFRGRGARLVIVDDSQEGWGHINVDHIVQTDDQGSLALASMPEPAAAELTRNTRISGDYLQLPLIHRADGSKPVLEKLTIESEGRLLRYMHVGLPEAGLEPDFWYSADLREFKGRDVTLRYKSRDPDALKKLAFGDQEIIDPKAYETLHRPRVHFSPRLGWMNDINGSYWHDGLYHLFYQFNPVTVTRGAGFDMHWGHSVSRDLVNWEEWPVALFPDAAGQCYSGTTVMQRHPVPGLNEGVQLPAPVLFFSATEPFTQHIATSPDGGRSWKRFTGNPVITNKGEGDRDPKVIWHEASQHYVMVLYVGSPDTYRFLRSRDLVKWEETSSLPHWFECPEFIPMKSAVTGEDLMLLYGCYRSPKDAKEPFHSNSCYQLGRFDGKSFSPVTKLRHAHLGPNFYAALIFVNEPHGRPIMMGWARDTRFPGEKFNQCASLPLHLQIKAMNGEDTLCFEPAAEVSALRGEPLLKMNNISIPEANAKLQSLAKDATLDVVLRLRPDDTGRRTITTTVRNITIHYDSATKVLTRGNDRTPIHPDDTLDIRFIIDRGLVESFWNGGEAAYAIASLHTDPGPAFGLEGDAMVEELIVYPMNAAQFRKAP